MGIERMLHPVLSRRYKTLLFFISLGILPRLVVLYFLPVDWNPDSYHHWQISYYSLKMGFSQLRMWDLNGCELYWGLIPHIVQSALMWLFNTSSMQPYRVLNILLGGFNTYLVYLIGRDHYYWKVGFTSALLLAFYPGATMFDVTGMQETLALTFALASTYLYSKNPGWSGLLLALACQSRIEYWMISIFFLVAVALIERFSTRIQAFIFSWLGVAAVFCLLFKAWSGNPFYPLYWSLFNVFGGWTANRESLPFYLLMISWLSSKLTAWMGKLTGIFILSAVITFSIYSLRLYRKKWSRYHVPLLTLCSTFILSPLFVTYLPSYVRPFLFMLRVSVPILALGSLSLLYVYYRIVSSNPDSWLVRLRLDVVMVLLMLAANVVAFPSYSSYMDETVDVLEVANECFSLYSEGTIVCDHPTLNYAIINWWGVQPWRLLSNQYSPNYYDEHDIVDYVNWFQERNVTLWIYSCDRAYPVWADIQKQTPELLVKVGECSKCKFYHVNQTFLKHIAENTSNSTLSAE